MLVAEMLPNSVAHNSGLEVSSTKAFSITTMCQFLIYLYRAKSLALHLFSVLILCKDEESPVQNNAISYYSFPIYHLLYC